MRKSKKTFKIISLYLFFKVFTLFFFINCAHTPFDYGKTSAKGNYYSNELLSISYCYFIPSGNKPPHGEPRGSIPLTEGIPFLIFGLLFLGFIGWGVFRHKKNPPQFKDWPQRAGIF
jgi:hypothetical protein